jgi:ABC-type glycerol-3-phosphate transport system permease component
MAVTSSNRRRIPRLSAWSGHTRSDWFEWFGRVLLAVWVVIQVVPLFYVLAVSLSAERNVGRTILFVLPRYPTLSNYPAVFDFFDDFLISFWRLLLNTSIYTCGGVLGALLVASTAAFAFATMEFKGRRLIFYLLLLALITPTSMLLIPEYVTLSRFRLLGGYHTLILPYIAFGLPLPILILTTFFQELPSEVLDSARVDGCNNLRLYWNIMMPMAQPALASSIIYLFLNFWNEFSLAMIAVKDSELMNIPLAMASLAYGRSDVVPWPLLATGIVVSSIPVSIIFLIFQGQLVRGLADGAVKG